MPTIGAHQTVSRLRLPCHRRARDRQADISAGTVATAWSYSWASGVWVCVASGVADGVGVWVFKRAGAVVIGVAVVLARALAFARPDLTLAFVRAHRM